MKQTVDKGEIAYSDWRLDEVEMPEICRQLIDWFVLFGVLNMEIEMRCSFPNARTIFEARSNLKDMQCKTKIKALFFGSSWSNRRYMIVQVHINVKSKPPRLEMSLS